MPEPSVREPGGLPLQERPTPARADRSVVLAWSPTCPHCKAMRPLVEEVAQEYEGRVRYQSLNVAERPDAARTLGIRGVPTLLAVSGSTVLSRHLGAAGLGPITAMFDVAAGDEAAAIALGPPRGERSIRIAVGLALGALAWWTGQPAVLGPAAVAVLVWALWPSGLRRRTDPGDGPGA